MGAFLDAYDQPKLNQEDKNYPNRLITSHEIEATIVSQKRKAQDLIYLLLISTRPLKKN
jgi:hypothetical protein